MSGLRRFDVSPLWVFSLRLRRMYYCSRPGSWLLMLDLSDAIPLLFSNRRDCVEFVGGFGRLNAAVFCGWLLDRFEWSVGFRVWLRFGLGGDSVCELLFDEYGCWRLCVWGCELWGNLLWIPVTCCGYWVLLPYLCNLRFDDACGICWIVLCDRAESNWLAVKLCVSLLFLCCGFRLWFLVVLQGFFLWIAAPLLMNWSYYL